MVEINFFCKLLPGVEVGSKVTYLVATRAPHAGAKVQL